jgi:phage protein D
MDLPFLDQPASQATITLPTVKLQFGSSVGDSPFGGIVDAVADLLGGTEDAWRTHLIAVSLRRALAPEVDVLVLELARSPHGPAPALDDEGSLEIGAADSLTKVFTGRIDAIRFATAAITVTACNGGRLLATRRVNRSYENASAIDIIGDLASGAGLSHQSSGSAASMPRYVVDDTRSLFEHVASLASLSGASVFFDGEGALQLIEANSGESVRTFTYGADVLRFSVGDRAAATASVDVVGEGAAGEAGSAGALWFRKDPAAMRATEGAGDPTRYYRDARLRSAAAVSARASALSAAHEGARTRGDLLVSGAPDVMPGSLVTLGGMPDSSCDGEYFVRRIVHRFDATSGFVSELSVQRRSSGGAEDLLGALGGLL